MENGRRTEISLGNVGLCRSGRQRDRSIRAAVSQQFGTARIRNRSVFDVHDTAKRVFAASVKSKKYALVDFASFINKRDAASILTPDVERFHRMLQQRVSESTAQSYVTTVRSFFKRLVEQKKIRLNPAAKIHRSSVRR